MPKRAVSFADDIETRTFKRATTAQDDEEFDLPEGHEINRTQEEALFYICLLCIEGQEDSTVDFDGNTKITAFNMKEDLEEGHFDADGNFIFDKKEKNVKDAWLDDIDWGAIKEKAGDQWEQSNECDDIPPPVLNDVKRREIFCSLIKLLKPNQTVAKALTDLKKMNGLSAAEERKMRWAAKKAGKSIDETDGQKDMKQLSGLADELLTAGHMDAYEWTREKIEFLLRKIESSAVDTLDIFSDAPAANASTSSFTNEHISNDDDEVKWEYKESEHGVAQGPFSSSEMATKQNNGELNQQGLARKLGSGGFNPVARIDFDLYC
uniref:GYF domain-containing protein n=1 Tax=Heterorhabditis bacteriophora TaxID=37862 RepID=A0A1I7XB79_HETBA